MRKKRFFQLNGWWLLFLLFLSIPAWVALIYFLIDTIKMGYFNFGIFLLYVIVMLPFIGIIFGLEKHRIVLRKNDIFVPADWLGKKAKIQFKTIIKYEEIQDIRIVRSAKNSLNKRITARMPNSFVLKPYLEFTCSDGNKRIFIMHFSKKQWAKIIDKIKIRMLEVGNNVTLLDTDQIIANSGTGGIVVD